MATPGEVIIVAPRARKINGMVLNPHNRGQEPGSGPAHQCGNKRRGIIGSKDCAVGADKTEANPHQGGYGNTNQRKKHRGYRPGTQSNTPNGIPPIYSALEHRPLTKGKRRVWFCSYRPPNPSRSKGHS